MRNAALALALLLLQNTRPGVVIEVRTALARKDWARAEALVKDYRAEHGATPEALEALSWLARGALAAGQRERAEGYAVETRRLVLEQLKHRELDAEPHLPLALGAAIEVQAQALTARGERGQAAAFLERELKLWRSTSLRIRIQKNLNLLTLVGKPAPPLEIARWLGNKPASLAALKGHAVLLFFWAHWCPDCKQEAPVLARLQAQYGSRGLVLVGPTQLYGYAARGEEVPPAKELAYADEVRRVFYGELKEMPVPVSPQNFKNYGASTTPTLVLIDRRGVVRLYHPGKLGYEELAAAVQAALD